MNDGTVTAAKKNYDVIDLFKFIACFFVVALHADAFNDISPTLNAIVCGGIARLAVPMFFTFSAFFFFKKEQTAQSIRKYCLRLGKLYLCWFIVSLPKTIFDRIVCGDGTMAQKLFRFFRSFFVTSTFSGSWFIVSCIFCGILFYFLEKLPEKKRKTVTIILSAIVYLFCVGASAYGKLIPFFKDSVGYDIYLMLFANPYNNLFTGIPYFALGRFFAKREKNVRSIPCLAAALALLIGEVVMTRYFGFVKATDCYLMLLPCTYFLIPFAVESEMKVKNAATMRIASTVVFFSQFLFLFACEFAEWALKITIPYFGKFLFAAVGGLLLTFVLIKLQKFKKLSWLKWFY